MSLIPTFEIGFLNGWWFTLVYLLIVSIPSFFYPKEVMKRVLTHPTKTKKEQLLTNIRKALFLGCDVICYFYAY